jgi:hypothetical protein
MRSVPPIDFYSMLIRNCFYVGCFITFNGKAPYSVKAVMIGNWYLAYMIGYIVASLFVAAVPNVVVSTV